MTEGKIIIGSLTAYAEVFHAQILASYQPKLIEDIRNIDMREAEERALAYYLAWDDSIVDYVNVKPKYIPVDDSVPVYLVREDKPKKDNAPWRRIPHKRGRAKRNRR